MSMTQRAGIDAFPTSPMAVPPRTRPDPTDVSRFIAQSESETEFDPLASVIGVNDANGLVAAFPPAALLWLCVPAKQRSAAMKAMLAGRKAVVEHMGARDVRSTVMTIAVKAVVGMADGDDEDFKNFVMVLLGDPVPGPAMSFVREEVFKLALLPVQYATVTLGADAAQGTRRFALIQVALLAVMQAHGPRHATVYDTVHQLKTIHGEAATKALSPTPMNQLVWTAELALLQAEQQNAQPPPQANA